MNFCCISDYNFSYKVLTLNQSLSKVMDKYNLVIYCLDDKIFNYINNKKIKNVKLFKVKNIQNDQFKKTIYNRSWVEYIWTATPIIIDHCLDHYHGDCIYVDSDLYFYQNPLPHINLKSNFDILITPHNFSKKYEHLVKYGKYCVQFIYFKSNLISKEILNEWLNKCIEWCYAKYENGKFGDQKYLEDWPLKYKSKVNVSSHKGYLGPWNIDDYSVVDGKIVYKNNEIVKPIFYHFHNLNFINTKRVDIGNYKINNQIFEKFYVKYINEAKENFSIINSHSKINIYKDFRNVKNLLKKYLGLSKNKIVNL